MKKLLLTGLALLAAVPIAASSTNEFPLRDTA